jgi:hypothetical protein
VVAVPRTARCVIVWKKQAIEGMAGVFSDRAGTVRGFLRNASARRAQAAEDTALVGLCVPSFFP